MTERDPPRTDAVAAAKHVGIEHGCEVAEPVVLQETNNVVVWLRPSDVVAKVGRWPHSEERLVREHAVATALAGIAPIATPLEDAGPTLDSATGYIVTLWNRVEHDSSLEVPAPLVGEALRELHEALAGYEGDLPSFRRGLSFARAALGDDARMDALPRTDLTMLRGAYDRLLHELGAYTFREQRLHGEPHMGNLLRAASGACWIDLEGVCVGPVEWDLAFLPDPVLVSFPRVDLDLLRFLRVLNSARVATWCWAGAHIGDMRLHAEYHLSRVREYVDATPAT